MIAAHLLVCSGGREQVAGCAGIGQSVCVVPVTRYAKSDGLSIAYQVFGEGRVDLVFVPGFVSHVEVVWEEPRIARFLERLAGFSRVVMFDKRGTGMSDRVSIDRLPTLEERMDDVRAVMDAAGSQRAALFGFSEGSPMCTLFAATYPQRTAALMIFGGYARWIRDEDFPWAPTRERHERLFGPLEATWGDVSPVAGPFAPSMDGDPDFAVRSARRNRMASSPGAAIALYRMNIEVDVRSILPSVTVPDADHAPLGGPVVPRRTGPLHGRPRCRRKVRRATRRRSSPHVR
jgi:pimeloyl-ACP methyl ester carboxylesterase